MIELPVDGLLGELVGLLGQRPGLVLRAPTGSGKTTRVPVALEREGLGPVILVEPRRVAARAAAGRMAMERGEELGQSVGYRVRFEKRVSKATRVTAVTAGMFLRMVLADPFLEGIGCVIFDEFHERHLDMDLGLALARRVQLEAREDLKLVVLSATIDPAPLERFLDAAVVDAPGKLFPIEVIHQASRGREDLEVQVVRAVKSAAEWLRARADSGRDVLVFLPGKGEIRRAEEALAKASHGFEVVVLHGELESAAQDRVLRRQKAGAKPRVILSTNVAESSVTIDGLGAVIDTGMMRQMRFDASVGLDRLELVRIAMPSVVQRMGRAGRTGPGMNLRLWSLAEERTFKDGVDAEISRVDLAGALLSLADFGESDPLAFDWFEAPPAAAAEQAMGLLTGLGAFGEGLGITKRGRTLASLPVHPRLGRLLLAGAERGVGERAALAAALLSERDVLGGAVGELESERLHESDLLERVELFEAAESGRGSRRVSRFGVQQIGRVRDSLLRVVESKSRASKHADGAAADEALLRAVFEAYPDRVARRREAPPEAAKAPKGRARQVAGAGRRGADRAQMVGGRGLALGDECRVRESELFLALEVGGATRGSNESFVRMASVVRRDWLGDVEAIEEVVACEVNEATGKVRPRRVRRWRGLVLDEAPASGLKGVELAQAREQALLEFAQAKPGIAFDLESDSCIKMAARSRFAEAHWGDASAGALPLFDPREFVQGRAAELVSGAASLGDLAQIDLAKRYLDSLDYGVRTRFTKLVPAKLKLPNGEGCGVTYDPERGPVLRVRIQDLFGWQETPRVAGVPLLLELCAPNGRPAQVTHDLAGFWAGSYALVRKDLAGRYPKQPWPDDPASAEPVLRRRRRR